MGLMDFLRGRKSKGDTPDEGHAPPPPDGEPPVADAPQDKPAPTQAQPQWADFLTPKQYVRFVELVETDLRRRNVTYRIEDGLIRTSDGGELGLLNLAQQCFGAPGDDWPKIIEGHFDSLFRSLAKREAIEAEMKSFEKVSGLLAARLWPEDTLDSLGKVLVYRRDIPGTVTVLVLDLPDRVQTISPDMVAAWGRAEEELFTLALDNVRCNMSYDPQEFDLDEGIKLRALLGNSFYVASRALLLEDHPELAGSHGTLIGLPHRHALLAFPIDDIGVLQAVQRMLPMVSGMFREGPGSVSPRLYWYHGGQFTDLPYRIDPDKGIVFSPPDEFVELLNQLAGESEQAS